MGLWRNLAGAMALATLFALAAFSDTAGAQEAPAAPILTIDQNRLFLESEFGKAVVARETAAAEALEAENASIEAGLIAEEQELTEKRATLPAVEFSALAAAFDQKVVRIRSEQDAKARELTRSREADRQAFLRAARPILGDLLVERKAVAIIDTSVLILSLSVIDVTDAAIAKVDLALRPAVQEQDADPEATPDPVPAPETAPDPAPDPNAAPAPSP
jgi:Skp family chaperone for outer membrane proteins